MTLSAKMSDFGIDSINSKNERDNFLNDKTKTA